MERRMEEQRERMAREFQEEVRRRQEQEEEKQVREEQEQGSREHKKSTTLVPNSPPVPALRDRLKREEEDSREKEEKKVTENETGNREMQKRDQAEAMTSMKQEQTLDVVGKLLWTDDIFLRSNSIT